MSKEFALFERDDKTFKTKLIRLMDLLISNKSTSQMETLILVTFSYMQLISGFYSEDVGLFTIKEGSLDSYFSMLKNIIRVKDLFKDNFATFQLLMIAILVIYALFFSLFIYSAITMTKNTFYSLKELMINLFLKIFYYMLLNPILDLSLSIICIGNVNPNYSDQNCSLSANPTITIICILVFLITVVMAFLLCFFYNNSVLLSNCYFARISCNYEIYHTVNIIIFSILLTIHRYISVMVFVLYNLIQSSIFLKFYFEKNPFYDSKVNFLIGFFHMFYVWTAFFTLIFNLLITSIQIQSIAYVVGIVLLYLMFSNLKLIFLEQIVLETPFYKISNNNHLLFYMKYLIDKINTLDNVIEDKSEFMGIIQMHMDECPMLDCMVKNEKADLYTPLTDEWSIPGKAKTSDRVYLNNFVTFVLSYFISQNALSPEVFMNISLYYLTILGNYCQSMIFIKRIEDFKLTFQEQFALIRAKLLISNALVEKMCPSNEVCFDYGEINTTMYFKYEDLSQKFFDEITNDVTLNLEFWKIFKSYKEENTELDFSKVFSLTDQIRISKNKIAGLWDDLFETYNGYNDKFDLYENYVSTVNDDDITFRELTALKTKILLGNDNLGIKSNYYNILFSKDTGVIIVNGEKGKEGNIEKVNENIRNFFSYTDEELKNINVNYLMPKMISKNHKLYMERYLAIGEKRVIDKSLKSYAKDKKNNIIYVSIIVKLFPMLGDNTCFCGLINKEPLDDVVIMDRNFNIQGMSEKLMKLFSLHELLFQDNEIPLYLICPQFINHYKLFMYEEIKEENKEVKEEDKPKDKEAYFYYNINKNLKENNGQGEKYEINENAELEFEIRIPQFLKSYVGKEEKSTENQEESTLYEEDKRYDDNSFSINSERDEHDSLMESLPTKNLKSKKTSLKDQTKDTSGDYQNKINYFKAFFDNAQFDELTKELEKVYRETAGGETFKFVFTFNKYTYGDNQLAFSVRCIDNREEENVSLNTENNVLIKDNENIDPTATIFTRTKNAQQIDKKIKVCLDDVEKIEKDQSNYWDIIKENNNYFSRFEYFRKEILNSSKIFKAKKSDREDEEAAALAASNATADDGKKQRIEEIKFNMLKNVPNFYTLKFIKITFIVVIITTAIFAVLYVYLFDNIYTDSLNVNQLSTNMYVNTFTISNLISNLISMRSLFEIKYFNHDVKFKAFNFQNATADFDYFNYQKNLSLDFFDKIQTQNSYIEYNITNYLQDNSNIFFWNKIESGITLPKSNSKNNQIGYPHAIQTNLVLVENLLNSSFFTMENAIFKNFTHSASTLMNTENRYKFYSTNAIEYGYNVLLVHQINTLSQMNSYFSDFNSSNVQVGIIVITIYSIFTTTLAFVYVGLLILTNNSMEQTLYKVSKINKENIRETISKIEGFNDRYLNRTSLNEKNGLDEDGLKKKKIEDDLKKKKEDERNANKNNLRDYSFEEVKKVKKLTILNSSYLQILFIVVAVCALLIPVYLETYTMIVNANLFLLIKEFIFKDLINTSLNIVSIKCAISRCGVKTYLSYNTTISSTDKQQIIDKINFYPVLEDFYNNKYLLSICDALYNVNSSSIYNNDKLKACLEDPFILSSNQTDNIFKSIADDIFALNKLILIQQNLIKNNPQFSESYYMPYGSPYFSNMEYSFYNYCLYLPDIYDFIFTQSLSNYMLQVRGIVLILIVLFTVLLIVFSLYIIVPFTQNLIHLLSISRCILKIIPTGVIRFTPELENWMESNF